MLHPIVAKVGATICFVSNYCC